MTLQRSLGKKLMKNICVMKHIRMGKLRLKSIRFHTTNSSKLVGVEGLLIKQLSASFSIFFSNK